jgi:hypothetical protein
MNADLYPLQWLLLRFSGWVNRHQQDVIEYLVEDFSGADRVKEAYIRRLGACSDSRRATEVKFLVGISTQPGVRTLRGDFLVPEEGVVRPRFEVVDGCLGDFSVYLNFCLAIT